MRRRYQARMSGPLLDRVDIQLEVERVSLADFGQPAAEEGTASIADMSARPGTVGSDPAAAVRAGDQRAGAGAAAARSPRLDASTTRVLDYALERGTLTARGYDRVPRLAWTLADLSRRDVPDTDDVGQALGLRQAAAASP